MNNRDCEIMLSTALILEVVVQSKGMSPDWFEEGAGICCNLSNIMQSLGVFIDCEVDVQVARAARTWEHYSGDEYYPIPGMGGKSACLTYCRTRDVWVGKYGALRKQLLRHCIECWEEKLNGAK